MATTSVPTDVVTVLHALGLDLIDDSADEITACCPKHMERTGKYDRNPSWSLNAENGLHHCWSCDYGGSLVGLVIDVRGCTRPQAKRFIRRNGFDIDRFLRGLVPEEPRDTRPEGWSEMSIAQRFEHFPSPPAKVLKSRGLEEWAAKQYYIRWNPWRHTWVIPWHDARRRFIGWQEKGDDSYKTWPKGMARGDSLFGALQLESSDLVLVVESPLDAVYLSQFDFSSVALGGSKLSLRASQQLLDVVEGEVVVATDNDEAGLLVAEQMRPLGRRVNLSYFNYVHTRAKDPGEMSQAEIMVGVEYRKHFLEV